ncbi:MAG TPA: TetR/AcrR family transcriptional regulator [Acidimicrobiales bacterium]|jgi:AcrR family transcriptional regulator
MQRRARTRRALLDATVRSLVERGYASTSTNDIIRLAGVSRGALLHHFASKAELMGEAVEHVFDRCEMEFREAFASMPIEDRTLAAAVDQLWGIFQGPSFDAALELFVAARTDPELRTVLLEVMARFERNVTADFGVLFPGTAAHPQGRAMVRFAFAALEGAALAHDLGLDHEANEVVAVLRQLASGRVDLLLVAETENETTNESGQETIR